MDVMKEDRQRVGVIEEDARDRVRWQMIHCGDPLKGADRRRRRK